MSVKTVLSSLSGREVEVFYALLVSCGNYTFLPELYDIFGRESTIKFLDIFSGCKIKVPKVEKLSSIAMKTAIYVRVEQATPGHRPDVLKNLAEEYDLSVTRVRDIYSETKLHLENELGISIRRIKRARL